VSLSILTAALRERRDHVSPFLVLGDPTPELSAALALAAIEAGATMLELGMPFSDPCADGPAIQAADARARAAGTSTERAFEILATIHARAPAVPKNLLVYGNLVHARGWQRFCEDAVAAGASSLLVPDVPLEESAPLRAASAAAGLGHVELVGPASAPQRVQALDRASDAFLYLAAHQGITGSPAGARSARAELVARTAAAARKPVCLGFGLSEPAHLRDAFAAGARIAVVGSHLARAIERALAERADVVERFRAACKPLIDAANEPLPQEN
jgi:tryptophan synthase alpha chain